MGVERRAELGEFLRSRRARLRPEEVGLPGHGTRWVPGLRREELALIAGVSVDHYVRLEQGRTLHFSESVLDAVASALRLNEVERAHLYRLARPWSGAETPGAQQVRPGLRRLLDAAADVPAYIVGRGTAVLAWNRLAAALITDFGALPPAERNLARLVFLDEGMRELYADWPAKAADVVAYLRLDATRNPGDPGIAALIDDLVAVPEFSELWERHELKDKTHGRYVYRHPVVGDIDLAFETLRLPDDPDQALVMHTTAPDSPGATALRLLSTVTGDTHAHR
ncbi:helix-turn-helix domain-containing protein [Nocardia puris]|uniref:helix-turn-helix transcriptional regulator n=1 Tax=Nocardia puris TaxID=208602 RepID=UPI00189575C3|nr:helix-turn-helix transcriptional regulator [Nocardia puris]MBF6213182.1 helix-turn-helix domain-containing protein [Nocardia puris]MBF6370216.1 helix-turn-helix domain-containing protein [Nocardia puris]MBF6462061.1 helix-turn-helix domain-containing protein [Nocardia puris]